MEIMLSIHLAYCYRPVVEFDLGGANAYIGELFKHETVVQLTPKLHAYTKSNRLNQICGFNVIPKDEPGFPFEVVLIDAKHGTGEIRVRNDVPVDFTQNRMFTFQIEAKDCEQPPNYSER